MKTLALCLAAAASLAAANQAAAQPADPQPTGSPRVVVGTLSCHERSGWGFIFGSSRGVRCTFSNGSGVVSRYEGSISDFGVDIGYQQSGVIIWSVLAPTDHLGPGALAGHYGGITASATVGVGLGANALIGGSSQGVVLQPVSIEGTTGLNVAGGIGGITLKYVPMGA